ncbi:hypothetical protein Poli38472_013291 [Pythium oligandrum]|uniref:Uncharacterized protein n=1 Tax=Pythium oligandrum TaxID=41045 RepID=A0A8K1C2U1_PYTOL|nr:hypothetical protein Poli38472_013291 [Pythium oligandrum]|eukprot:TMW55400.1 hypothetical protein Poli38472_013291 [Pythium oligandrum]
MELPIKRKWTDEDDRSKTKAKMPVVGVGFLARLGDNRLTRGVLLPILRFWWPCTPRKLVRNAATLLVTSVLVVIMLEALGRIRFQGYLISTDDGNGQMGFYHEMDVDMRSIQESTGNADSRLFPAWSSDSRELRAWMAERRRRTNGRKFLVGCSPDWKGYVLRSFSHLFQDLKSNHGWDDLVTENPLDYFYRQDAQKAPSVLFFCLNSSHYPFYLFLDHNKYFQELRALGTLIVVWSDDLQYFDQFNPTVIREKILKRADVLMGSYTYMVDDYFASATRSMNPRDLPITMWLPHSAGPDFTLAPFNEYPIDKILLSGRLGENWYPLRHWLGQFQETHSGMMDLYKHSGYYVVDNQTEIYASYLRSYRVGVTTTLIHQFLIAKAFEIPSTGALLLINSDLAPLLEALGLHEDEHFVTFDRRDPAPKLWWVVSPENRATVDAIRKNGMRAIRDHHMVRNRVMALDLFLSEGVTEYHYPATYRTGSPCPMVAMSESKCESSFAWNARYKCDRWFCGALSFVGH